MSCDALTNEGETWATQHYVPRHALAVDTASLHIDAAGPEMRQYQAQYIDGDDPVGLVSETLTATVPG